MYFVYTRRRKKPKCANLVGLSGLEPPTSRLSGVRSNRLSYRPMQGIMGSLSSLRLTTLCCSHILIFAFQCPTFVEHWKINSTVFFRPIGIWQSLWLYRFSLERRWSSRTFRYGYLVTTSPQLPTPPSTAASLRLAHRLRVLSALMVWRAVCTRPGTVFTATFWFALTSNSDFMQASCSLQSELRPGFVICSTSRYRCTLLPAIVVRV